MGACMTAGGAIETEGSITIRGGGEGSGGAASMGIPPTRPGGGAGTIIVLELVYSGGGYVILGGAVGPCGIPACSVGGPFERRDGGTGGKTPLCPRIIFNRFVSLINRVCSQHAQTLQHEVSQKAKGSR